MDVNRVSPRLHIMIFVIVKTIFWLNRDIFSRLGKGAKKIRNVNFFQREGGGVNPKVYIFKRLYTVKRGFKMDFFTTKMCFGKF